MGKIFRLQNITEIGLSIYQINGCLFQAVTPLIVNIAGILTIRAGILRLQIVFRITVVF